MWKNSTFTLVFEGNNHFNINFCWPWSSPFIWGHARWKLHQILIALVGSQCKPNAHPHLIVERKFLSGLAFKFMWPPNIIHFTTCMRACSTFSFMVWHGQSHFWWPSVNESEEVPLAPKLQDLMCNCHFFSRKLVRVNFTKISMKILTLFHCQLHIHFLDMGLNGELPQLVVNLDTRRLTLYQVS